MERVIPDVFDDLEIGITLHDPETGAIVGVNERLEELYGYSADQLKQMDVGEYSVPDGEFTQAEAERRIRAAAEGEPQTFEWHVERGDGSTVWVRVRLAGTTLDGEEYVVAEIRDITDQKAREQELQSQQALVQQSLDAMDDAFYVLDTAGNLQRWNDTVTEVTGYTDEEIAEMHALDFFEGEGRETVAETIEEILAEGSAVVEADYVTRDGTHIPYEFTGTRFTDADGNLRGIIGIGRDLSDRQEREQQLEASNERLQRFAYTLSHDLQEPLRMVSSYVDLLEMELADELDEETREYMDYAVDGAERMQAMIDGLLDYSRVETRGGEFEPTDVSEVLDGVLQDLEFKLADATVSVDADALPVVHADPQQVGQLFQNLLTNAVDHGGPETTVEIDATEHTDTYEFTVTDDGPGIPEAEQDGLFELFEKGPDSDGTGIGLAVCERIVDRHGEDIAVESTPGEGTTFRFSLPKPETDAAVSP